MQPRFVRDEAHDLRQSKGDPKDCDAWEDHAPKWDQAALRFFPVGLNPNEDPRYLD